jgi:hypothetical protein
VCSRPSIVCCEFNLNISILWPIIEQANQRIVPKAVLTRVSMINVARPDDVGKSWKGMVVRSSTEMGYLQHIERQFLLYVLK